MATPPGRSGALRKRLGLPLVLCVSVLVGQLHAQEGEGERAAALGRLATELAGGGTSGRLIERTPGRFVFAPQGDQLVVPVANPDRVARAAVGPLLKVHGELDPANGQLALREYRIDLAPQIVSRGVTEAMAPADPLIDKMDTLVSEFAEEVDEALKPGAMSVEDLNPEGQGKIAVEDRRVTGELADVYAQAVADGNTTARDAAVENYATVREQLKAIYDTYDNYPPWSYDQIHRNASAVVAIGEHGASRAICSGVLVGQDLVLTAAHCFEFLAPEELEIWFDFVEDPRGQRDRQARPIKELVAPSVDKRDAFDRQEFGRDLYDYAIVRFTHERSDENLIPRAALPSCRAEPDESPPFDASPDTQANWQDMREEWQTRCIRRPQCLLDGRARRDWPLYVVGYPKGERETVHDNAWVYLPHQLNANDFDRLKLAIEADYTAHPDRDAILEQFTNSYVLQGNRYLLEDERVNFQPKLGIVADTFRGNSGSPVYDRDQHCLVGMLISGAEDRGQRLLATWQHHESALPASAIISDLKKHSDTKILIDQELLEIR
jgi:hypothetical protein